MKLFNALLKDIMFQIILKIVKRLFNFTNLYNYYFIKDHKNISKFNFWCDFITKFLINNLRADIMKDHSTFNYIPSQ